MEQVVPVERKLEKICFMFTFLSPEASIRLDSFEQAEERRRWMGSYGDDGENIQDYIQIAN